MKKKTLAIALVVALLAIGIVGGTIAYFQDTQTAENTFTFGKVKIRLSEEGSTEQYGTVGTLTGEGGLQFTEVLPGQTYSKVPVITVEDGSSDCWVVATVTIDAYDLIEKIYKDNQAVHFEWGYSLAGSGGLVSGGVAGYEVKQNVNSFTSTGSKKTIDGHQLILGGKDVAFVTYDDNNGKGPIVYTYYFNEALKAKENQTLFTSITIPKDLTQEMLEDAQGNRVTTNFKLTVKAYAIQKDGFTDAYHAYTETFPTN